MSEEGGEEAEESGSRALRWLGWLAVITLPAILLGYGLARFALDDSSATSIQNAASVLFAPEDAADNSFTPQTESFSNAAAPSGPLEPLVCEGCGPTLAERELQAQGGVGNSAEPTLEPPLSAEDLEAEVQP